MSSEDIRKEYEQLKEQIRYHNFRYHVDDDPVISDYEYDRLIRRLKAIETEHPDWVTPTHPASAPARSPSTSSSRSPTPRRSSAWPTPSVRRTCGTGTTGSPGSMTGCGRRISPSNPSLDGLTVVLHYTMACSPWARPAATARSAKM